jgi:hypothetical protein
MALDVQCENCVDKLVGVVHARRWRLGGGG